MDIAIFSAIQKLPFYTVPYRYPNAFDLFTASTPISNNNLQKTEKDVEQLTVISNTQQHPSSTKFIKQYLVFILAFFPAATLVLNTIIVLTRPIISKQADQDPELTLLAVAICIPTAVFGIIAWAVEFAIAKHLTEVQNVIFRLAEFHLVLQNEDKTPDVGKKNKRTQLIERKLLPKLIDGYMINCVIVGTMVSLTPLFLHVDPTYFLMKTFFPQQKKSLWVSVIRSAWMAITVHRWIMTGTHIIIYILASFYFFRSTLRRVSVGRSMPTEVQTASTESETRIAKAVSGYKQLYILLHCHHLNFGWVMALILQGLWVQLIISFTTCVWYSGSLLFTKPWTYMVFPFLAGFFLVVCCLGLTMAGGVHELASNFVNEPLGLIRERKYYTRVKRGLRPFGIQFGHFYFIESNYFPLFLLSALDQIIGLLMSVQINA